MEGANTTEETHTTHRSRELRRYHPRLTEREATAIAWSELGYSSSGIARKMGSTESTIKHYLRTVEQAHGTRALFSKPPEERSGPLSDIGSAQLELMGYNPDDVKTDAESSGKNATMEGEIATINETYASEIYGDDANDPEREMIEAEVVVETPSGVMTFSDTFSLPTGPHSWANPNFKMGNFHDYYGDVPREGQDVEVEYNDDGYLRIKVEE